eukprot:jgi/Mesvir1/14601/Mv05272-RA.1
MVVAICFLLNRRFYTAGVWKDWLSIAPKGQVRFFVHADKFRGADADALTEWVRECDAVEVPRVPTRWAYPSLLRAEMNLLDAAVTCADVAHVGLVSENTAPCVSPSALLTMCARIRDKSLFESYECASLSARTKNLLIRLGCSSYMYHSQFFLLAAGHYRAIRAPLRECVDAYGATTADFIPSEEFTVLTLLDKVAGDEWEHAAFVLAIQDDVEMHATWLDDEWIRRELRERCERAAKDVDDQKVPSLCAVRKVRDTPALREALERAGVLPPGTTPTPCYERPKRKASANADYRD